MATALGKIKVVGPRAMVQLSHLEALAAARLFHPVACVPLTKIRIVRVSDDPWHELSTWLQYRSAWYEPKWCPCNCPLPLWFWGTFIPGLVTLGTLYRKDMERAFVALYRDRPAVIVEMQKGRPGWDLLVVSYNSAEEAERTAQELNKAVAAANEEYEMRSASDAAAALEARDRCERAMRTGRQQAGLVSAQQEQQQRDTGLGGGAGGAASAPAGPAAAEPQGASGSRSSPHVTWSSSSGSTSGRPQKVHEQHHAIPSTETAQDTPQSSQESRVGEHENASSEIEAAEQPGDHQHAVMVDEEGRELHEAAHIRRHQQQQQPHAAQHGQHSGHVVVVDEQGEALHDVADEPAGAARDVEEGRQCS